MVKILNKEKIEKKIERIKSVNTSLEKAISKYKKEIANLPPSQREEKSRLIFFVTTKLDGLTIITNIGSAEDQLKENKADLRFYEERLKKVM
jgi:hypothetical protein